MGIQFLFTIIKKFFTLILTLLSVSLISFFLLRLIPGDPVLTLLGERGADPELYESMRKSMGLHLPLWQQYFTYMAKVFQGDLGNSVLTQVPVLKEFTDRIPATLELGLSALTLSILIGIPLGILAAVKRGSWWDFSIMGFSLMGFSLPIFWWGPLLILFFSVFLGMTPVSGRIDILYDIDTITGFFLIDTLLDKEAGLSAFKNACLHLVLPCLALGTIPLATITRMTRASMLDVLSEDYIRFAKSKGLGQLRVLFNHALRNALIPIITIIGLSLSTLVTGAVLTETIFSWPGIGKWMVNSVSARDYPAVQGGLLLTSTMVIIVNFLVDLSYLIVNPKLRGGKN